MLAHLMAADDAPLLEFAFEARVAIAPEEHVGHGEGDEVIFVPITGGTVEGPRLRAEIVPGGGDWMVRRGGTYAIEARYLMRADDGALIDVVNRGFYRASPETEAALAAGEPVDPADVYFRTSPVFRTDAPDHRWLAETVFVGMARDEGERICIRFYAVD
jgi:hypothetical protein